MTALASMAYQGFARASGTKYWRIPCSTRDSGSLLDTRPSGRSVHGFGQLIEGGRCEERSKRFDVCSVEKQQQQARGPPRAENRTQYPWGLSTPKTEKRLLQSRGTGQRDLPRVAVRTFQSTLRDPRNGLLETTHAARQADTMDQGHA